MRTGASNTGVALLSTVDLSGSGVVLVQCGCMYHIYCIDAMVDNRIQVCLVSNVVPT